MTMEGAATGTGIDRAQLLPRSGIGVDGAWLVIAPPGNPIIRLDARLLDRVELIGRSPTAPLVWSGVATAGVAAAALSWIPGSWFACAGLAYLAHERFSEARRRSRSRDLLLALGDLEVALHVADGPEAAKGISEQLAPYTRDAPITRPEVYEDAKRRMRAQAEGKGEASARRELENALLVGADVVYVRGDYLQVGNVAFRISEVREYALRGANLPLTGGRLLQAAMGLLVVAAEERAAQGEDVAVLSKRIAEYESWSGHTAGRRLALGPEPQLERAAVLRFACRVDGAAPRLDDLARQLAERCRAIAAAAVVDDRDQRPARIAVDHGANAERAVVERARGVRARRDELRDQHRERAGRTLDPRRGAEIDHQLDAGRDVVIGEPQTVIDGGREIEPAGLVIEQRAFELVELARERRRLEVRTAEILTQRLDGAPRIRRRARRHRDVTLEVIDDQAESIAQPAQRIGELLGDIGTDLADDQVSLLLGHKLPVSKNQPSPTPSEVRPCEYPISNVPGTK